MLRFIKTLHTVVWAFFVACILGIYHFAAQGRFRIALVLIAIVLGESLVLVLNRRRCPLTGAAARFTPERAPNFDIYLPVWLARYNQQIFGTLYALAIVFTLLRWAS